MTKSQCTFWCLVLSDPRRSTPNRDGTRKSQCTFWCSVLSDREVWWLRQRQMGVSMHLLVLGAFRRTTRCCLTRQCEGLNAPSGAWCFPTESCGCGVSIKFRLNAPSGAWCFPTRSAGKRFQIPSVSMHLLVLGAFRHEARDIVAVLQRSQCTFWCLVLSDVYTGCLSTNRILRLNAPSGAWCFPTPPPENSATTPLTEAKSPPT